jgi:6,7-dimethyl-8-ribityllumazine synthase
MYTQLPSSSDARGLRIGVVVSRYHEDVTDALHDGAMKYHDEAGGRTDDLVIVRSPGAYELVAICRALAHEGGFDAIVALGCIITGETTHDEYIADSVAHGLMRITVATGVPITFGVLTCQTLKQARARAGGDKGNKGAEAMAAAIEAANAIRAVRIEHAAGTSASGSGQ